MTLVSQNTANGYSGGDYLSEDTVLRSYPLYPTRKRRCCHVDGDGFTIITICFFVLTVAITVALIAQIYYGSPEVTPHGAVATDAEACSSIGIDIMKEGGSAVDVAIASLLCMSVVHPHVIGPGGSGVMLVHDHKTNSSTVLDFMSGVPRAHQENLTQPSPTDVRSIGVPGFLRGLEYAHSKFGKLQWSSLFQQSIQIAREGFAVSKHLEDALKLSNITQIDGITSFDRTFLPRGVKLQEGRVIRREEYADFLDTVSHFGAGTLYIDFGPEEMKLLQELGSDIRIADFENYKVRERPCIHISVKNRTLFTAPAPFGGPQLLTAMQLLRNSNLNPTTPSSTFYHSVIEAIRKSYAGFMSLMEADELSRQNLTEVLLNSTGKEAIDSTVTLADPTLPRIPEQAATSVSVIDTFDQYVTAVVGLGTYFGSRVMTKHGILFNNHLANVPPHTHEMFHPSHARPLTTYAPLIMTDSQQVCGPRVVLSSPKVGAVLQVASQMVFNDVSITQAIEQPRIVIRPGVDKIFVEDDLGDANPLLGSVRTDLLAMNHSFQFLHLPYSSVNGISKIKDKLTSYSDARGGGVAHRLEPLSKPPGNSSTVN